MKTCKLNKVGISYETTPKRKRPSFEINSQQIIYFCIKSLIGGVVEHFSTGIKFRGIGVPTRDSFSRRILKVCNLGLVESTYVIKSSTKLQRR